MVLDHPPQRIVSLVPSMTESLFDLGFGQTLVGITDFCIHPRGELANLQRVGGTKDPRIEDIIQLHPDLVIVNQEENDQPTVLKLEQSGIPVWLTFPKTVDEAISDLWGLSRLFRSDLANAKIRMIEKTVEYARLAAMNQPPFRYFCPIWYESYRDKPWWMTFNQDTFSNDLLSILGARNVFADRKRRYPLDADLALADPEPPGDRDDRYPRIGLQEVAAAPPDVIFLPDEPYSFGEGDARRLQELYRTKENIDIPVLLIEGSLITWPGTRIAKAVIALAPEFTKLTNGLDGDKL